MVGQGPAHLPTLVALAEASGIELVTLGWTDRRVPVAAATPELLAEAVSARQGFPVPATVA